VATETATVSPAIRCAIYCRDRSRYPATGIASTTTYRYAI
jgi:hypothetical protein